MEKDNESIKLKNMLTNVFELQPMSHIASVDA